MDLSIDNAVSKHAFGLNNRLSPAYKSISFWALTAMLIAVLFSAVRHYREFNSSGHLYELVFLGTCAALYVFYIMFRVHVARAVDQTNFTDATSKSLTRASSAASVLCGVGLVSLLVAFTL